MTSVTGDILVSQMRALFLQLLLLFCISAHAAEHADRIFYNGNLWTADDAHPHAQAIAISGQTILAVGTNDEIKSLGAPDTVLVDLHGRLMVPGFQDSHLHFPGPSVNSIALTGAEDLKTLQTKLHDFAASHASRPWITGGGWGYTTFPDRKPNKKYLDEIVSDRPVYLHERDGHMGLANSKALAIAGVTRATPDPPNGHIVRDPDGEPTGELQESAQELVFAHIPPATVDDYYDAVLKHMDEAAAAGLTFVQNAHWSREEWPAFERALAAGKLKLRFRFAPGVLPDEGLYPANHKMKNPLTEADLDEYKRLRETFRGPLIEFGSVKGMLDGTVDAKTAAMFDPYVGGGKGIPFWEQDELNQVVALYDREGFQVMLHAIGDRAIHMALDAFEYAARTNGTSGRRHRVEHAEVPLLSDLPRFRQLGVIASTQAMFANPDSTTLQNFAVVLGPERASHADSFKLYDDAGAVQAFGSDWSVFPFEPLPAIYCAVTRMTPEGTPAGGWYPQGRISVEAALRHFTRDGAYATFDENRRGSLTPGKLADFVVLSQNILTLPPDQILKTKILLTVMGGADTYRNPEFP
jgi:predicted amidohydrolase YtcJ